MIAKLKIAPQYLPEWFVEELPSHIPLPTSRFHELEGEIIVWGVYDGEKIPLLSLHSGKLISQYKWEEWKSYILGEQYRELQRPFYTKLPFNYHRIPDIIRRITVQVLTSRQTKASREENGFPGYPIEQGLELLDHVYRTIQGEKLHQTSGQIILTHDIETHAGFTWAKKIATLEREYGFRSLWHIVAHRYTIEYNVLDWLAENGFDIGLHGYNHDSKLIFLSESKIRQRLDRCKPLLERYHIKSFRSPAFFRNDKLFQVLKDYVQYDYSYLDTDIFCPGGHGGCLWTKPFSFSGLIHIPTTLPYDAPLYFRYTPKQLPIFWKQKIEWLRSCSGNIVVNTHPDPLYSGNIPMLKSYEQLLILLKNL